MPPHPALASIVGGDLDDHDRLHPGQHDAIPPAAEPGGGHRVRPRMILGDRRENRRHGERLGSGERGAATDHPQRAVLLYRPATIAVGAVRVPITAPITTSVVSRDLTLTQRRTPGSYREAAPLTTRPSIPAGRYRVIHRWARCSSAVTGDNCSGGVQSRDSSSRAARRV